MGRRRLRWLAATVVLIVAAVAWTIRPYQVVGSSMEPQYKEGDWVWTVPLWRNPERGEVVIFEAPDGSGRSMKRVAGLPGEAPQRDFERLQPHPDLPPIETSRVQWGSATHGGAALPAGSFFLLGDHLADSIDSRDFGPVPSEAMHRRVLGAVRDDA